MKLIKSYYFEGKIKDVGYNRRLNMIWKFEEYRYMYANIILNMCIDALKYR